MRQPTQRMTPNTVIVYNAPTYSADPDGSPIRNDGGGTPFSVAIAIDTEPMRSAAQGTILSVDVYKVIFYADPGVISPDVRIEWTADITGTLTTPIPLFALGGAVKPLGRCSQWIVKATRKT